MFIVLLKDEFSQIKTSSFTHTQVVQFLSSTKHKTRFCEECWGNGYWPPYEQKKKKNYNGNQWRFLSQAFFSIYSLWIKEYLTVLETRVWINDDRIVQPTSKVVNKYLSRFVLYFTTEFYFVSALHSGYCKSIFMKGNWK